VSHANSTKLAKKSPACARADVPAAPPIEEVDVHVAAGSDPSLEEARRWTRATSFCR